MGKGILSGVFWGIVASALVSVVLTALSPLERDQAAPGDPTPESTTPQPNGSDAAEIEPVEVSPPAIPEAVAEPAVPEAVEESPQEQTGAVAEAAPETAEPTPRPEVAAEPETPEVANIEPEMPQIAPAPENEAPEAPQMAELQPAPAVESEPEPESETAAKPIPLPEVTLEEAPATQADPAELPAPEVVAELTVPDQRLEFDPAPETTVPALDQAALSEAAPPSLLQSDAVDAVPGAGLSVSSRPSALEGPDAPRPEVTADTAPDLVVTQDSETQIAAVTPALPAGSAVTDKQPRIMAEPGPRVAALDAPDAPELGQAATDIPTLSESDDAPPRAETAPERVALATDPVDRAPEFDTRPATPLPPKTSETTEAIPAPGQQAPSVAPAPQPAATPPTPKEAPAPKAAAVEPDVVIVEPEVAAPANEATPDDRSASLPKVVSPGGTRPGGLPRVRRLGQLGSSSIGVGSSGPGLSQRIPRITAPSDTPEVPEAEVVPEPENPEPVGALERNAAPFSDDSGRPLMALVVVADGDAASLVSRVDGLGGQVTVALDPSESTMRSVAPDLKARGHEVLIVAEGLPASATPRDVEVSLTALVSEYPDAVGLLLPPDGAIVSDRALLKQAMEFAAATGHAVVTAQSGLDTAGRIAQGAGARALGVYRRLDGTGESAATITRTLDRATFQAARDGNVAVLGGLGDQTIAGLTQWRDGLRGDSVVLAPLSALLLGGI